MGEPSTFTIHIDGAARGNPGPAAFAYVIERDGEPPIEDKGCLGTSTNNQAEYTALVKVLERAAQLQARRLLIHSDSELLVKQMNGVYRVKNEDLRQLYEQAKRLAAQFERVTLRHVLRARTPTRIACAMKPWITRIRRKAAASAGGATGRDGRFPCGRPPSVKKRLPACGRRRRIGHTGMPLIPGRRTSGSSSGASSRTMACSVAVHRARPQARRRVPPVSPALPDPGR